MFSRSIYLDFFIRSAVGVVLGVIFAVIISEGTFLLMPNKQSADREPRRIDLVIPYGTSEQVEAGVYNRSLPDTMTFVQGDVLVVKNEDVVTHQLGPMLVPAQTSGVLEMSQANDYGYECTFQPTNYMGITVLARVDNSSRLQAILAIGLPTGMMLAVYSYLIPAHKLSFLKRPKESA
jgi:hypothetical protein